MNYFSDDELRCQCGCNELIFDPAVRTALNAVRMEYGKPMVVTSGYRCPNHPIEAKKSKPGEHTLQSNWQRSKRQS
jgi:zinc D-Ala-D-Ala carboxypeptidase